MDHFKLGDISHKLLVSSPEKSHDDDGGGGDDGDASNKVHVLQSQQNSS